MFPPSYKTTLITCQVLLRVHNCYTSLYILHSGPLSYFEPSLSVNSMSLDLPCLSAIAAITPHEVTLNGESSWQFHIFTHLFANQLNILDTILHFMHLIQFQEDLL